MPISFVVKADQQYFTTAPHINFSAFFLPSFFVAAI
jgi:hypothetical protein